jgi:hypothetical protein
VRSGGHAAQAVHTYDSAMFRPEVGTTAMCTLTGTASRWSIEVGVA